MLEEIYLRTVLNYSLVFKTPKSRKLRGRPKYSLRQSLRVTHSTHGIGCTGHFPTQTSSGGLGACYRQYSVYTGFLSGDSTPASYFHPRKCGRLQRKFFQYINAESGDVILPVSTSGRNAFPVEMVMSA